MLTLQVKRHSLGDRDAHGNQADVFADPIDWPVFGVNPVAAMETTADNRDRSVITPIVYAPPGGNAPTEYDRVVYNGQDYEVNGRPADWTEGPYIDIDAGITVVLKRVEG